MPLITRIKTIFIGIIIFLLCYISVLKFAEFLSTSPKISFADHTTRVINLTRLNDTPLFIFSNENTYQVVRGINDKNCLASKGFLPHGRNLTKCDDLRQCNSAGKSVQGLPNGCRQRLPSSIIIGVYKAGTRELLDYLAMHPGIVIRRLPYYEISFFSTEWSKGFQWYREEMPFSMPGQITIEKSPNYFSDANTPKRIQTMNPDIKLILIIRDPVKRGLSHLTYTNRHIKKQFLHNITKNGIPEHLLSSVFSFSVYDEPFDRYLHYFNRSQIYIVDSDRFKSNPYDVLFELETFLDLPHMIQKADMVFNELKGFYCLQNVTNHLSASCFAKNRGRQETRDDIKRAFEPILRRLYKPHNERFFKLAGRTYNWT